MAPPGFKRRWSWADAHKVGTTPAGRPPLDKRMKDAARAAGRAMPRGGSLPEAAWHQRHRWLLRLLWLHAIALPAIAAVEGSGALHALAIGAVVSCFGLVGASERIGREGRTLAVALGLVSCSAILVHEWDATEAHFHFFVMVMALTVYEDWAPLAAAVAFLIGHRAVLGVTGAADLYGHDGDPWLWAGVHGLFTLAAIAAVVASWGVNESVRRTAADTEEALRASERRLLEEQATLRMVAGVARDIATKPDARSSICAATREGVGSTFASLWEVEGDSRLALTAMEGADVTPGLSIQIGREPSGAAIAFLSGMRYFAPDARDNPSVSQRMVQATGARSLLFEPVRRGDQVIAVMAIGWSRQVSVLSAREGSVIRLLADEAAVAIERSDMIGQLAALARTDPLTGLANRRVWEERLPVEIARAERGSDPLSLLVVDLDDFKAVNDAQGHQAGDRMLKAVAAAWRGVIRPTDLLARFGGDEFVVLVPGCHADAAVQLADRLRAAMPDSLTCSVGVVEWAGDDGEAFLSRGDAALYEAKTLGRDRTAAR